jgi:hypothetical protein
LRRTVYIHSGADKQGKAARKANARFTILKQLAGADVSDLSFAIQGRLDWGAILGEALSTTLRSPEHDVIAVPITKDLIEWIMDVHECDLIDIAKDFDLTEAPNWLTVDLMEKAEVIRRDKQRLQIAHKVNPIVRGFLLRRRVHRKHADFGQWSSLDLLLDDLLKKSESKGFGKTWVQLKLDYNFVVQDEYNVYEDVALAAEGDDDDVLPEEYEEGELAFPEAKVADMGKIVCNIQMTKDVVRWLRKV